MDLARVPKERRGIIIESHTIPTDKEDVRQAVEGYTWEEAQAHLKEAFIAEDNTSSNSPEARLNA
jgi:hypothetical protein